MTVDGAWALIGSANWDARSFRLNLEFTIECYDPLFVGQLDALIATKMANATTVRAQDLHARPLPLRLRDGVARLLSPYL